MSDELTRFQIDLLATLNNTDGMHGLGIKETLEQNPDYAYDAVNHGRMYPNLDTLARQGYIAKTQADKRTNEYALTQAGADLLAERVNVLGGHSDE